eukprot:Gb_02206 [translate_table: standard]
MCFVNHPLKLSHTTIEDGRSAENGRQRLPHRDEATDGNSTPSKTAVNFCLCSPTSHAGSFRCRWHRSSYEWGQKSRPTCT